ncbi:gamma-glutamyl hydrolase-like [Xenia sp. Carnegie-2017]|uniref:gamma-glutamyl hydrolase-like n=1 Tax=Xenia sp. Carnegie-2017 TaxID=2897299 RepID=UPI001F03CE64|nr:gamma-glutamyl hydrolase-like [Xenia sp. Carnegie-2017]
MKLFDVKLAVYFLIAVLNSREKLVYSNLLQDRLNNRPIIGILAQSTEGENFQKFGSSYISASYIKYIESSGARVVPVRNDLNENETEELFRSINGVLFPGGGVDLVTSGYARIGKQFYNLAKKSFDIGDYFPIWGSCLGHQFLSFLASEDENILSMTNSENYPIPLNFTADYRDSRLFTGISEELAKFASNADSTINMHRYSVLVSKFKKSKKMKNIFRTLSTNNDRDGKEFVSTMEGVKYPFYGSQWHPEKNSFEWTLNENIPHQEMSIKLTQYMSNFFVNEARQSMHRFSTREKEEASLIYNYTPTFTGNISNFEQCYFFQQKRKQIRDYFA